jgi:uncharacterized protein (TIGR03435 family)
VRISFLCVAALLAPQAPLSAQSPKFEVASIKECKIIDRPPPSTNSPGRLSLGCWPLWRLIADAYQTFAAGRQDPLKLPVPQPPEGRPDWMSSARYSIDAKAETPQDGAMLRGPMMRALLEERFQLKAHLEMREVSGYIMTVDKGGLKLKLSTEDSCVHADLTNLTQSSVPGPKPWCLNPIVKRGPVTVLDVQGIPLDVFCRLLNIGGSPVINGTGLTLPYDIHLEWTPDEPSPPGAAAAPPASAEIAAMRSQLGLRLDPGKGKREFLVIDHIERPSEN